MSNVDVRATLEQLGIDCDTRRVLRLRSLAGSCAKVLETSVALRPRNGFKMALHEVE